MSLKYLFAACLLAAITSSCTVSKTTTNTKPSNTTGSSEAAKFTIAGPSNAVSYVEQYKRIAVAESIRTGIPASIKLAQGILESGYGGSPLAKKSNNHFGIKCGSGWSGKTVQYKGSCYRVFRNGNDAYKEHSFFLVKGSRYKDLFKLKRNDYKGWAKGLRKAGYATNPKYPSILIELIERYKLYNYDK
ncbi:MAG: glucosaminidase domain-containing protein [Aureispira sp.]|nr:glucosaminidase domain-containing protein [Aureispira sp.]